MDRGARSASEDRSDALDPVDRERARPAEQRAEVTARALVEASPDIVLVLDADRNVRYASPSARETVGDDAADVASVLHPDDVGIAREALDAVFSGSSIDPVTVRVRGIDGRWHHLETVARNLLDDAGVGGIVLTARDVSDRVEAEEARRRADDRLRRLIDHSFDVITVFTAEGICKYASPAVGPVFGEDPDELVGRDAWVAMHPDDRTRVREEVTAQLRGTRARRPIRYRRRHHDGTWRIVESIFTMLLDDPVIEGVVCNTRDVTELVSALDRLEHEAVHDPLTGLGNRRALFERLPAALARQARRGRPLALLYLDLDGFKAINDQLGHAAGDEVLRRVATGLREATRASDETTRVGGDEFVIVAEDIEDREGLAQLAHRVVDAIRGVEVPGGEAHLDVSIGAALVGSDVTPDAALQEVDVLVYRAKRGKLGVVLGD